MHSHAQSRYKCPETVGGGWRFRVQPCRAVLTFGSRFLSPSTFLLPLRPPMDIDSPPSNTIPDPHSHVTLPSFSASFPLPFRVLFLVGLATLLWALNLHVLAALRIDISAVLDLRDDPGGDGHISLEDGDDGDERAEQGILSPRVQPLALTLNEDTPMRPANTRIMRPSANKLYGPMYKLFLMYCGWVGTAWVLFRYLSGEEEEAMERWRVIPGLAMVGVVAAVAVPWRGVLERERAGFRRCVVFITKGKSRLIPRCVERSRGYYCLVSMILSIFQMSFSPISSRHLLKCLAIYGSLLSKSGAVASPRVVSVNEDGATISPCSW